MAELAFNQWADRWRISPQALQELRALMNVEEPPVKDLSGYSEAAVQQQIRLETSGRGIRLWRNNNGACMDQNDRMIRYGLANDSKALNARIKSSDLIGATPHIVQPADVGRTLGIFTSYETKRAGWKYTGTPREVAQLAWGTLILSLGGIFKFISRVDDLY